MSQSEKQSEATEEANSTSKGPNWKPILAALLILIIGFAAGFTISSSQQVRAKDTHEYRQLERQYNQVKSDLHASQEELDSTKDRLKDAQDDLKDERKDNAKATKEQTEAEQDAARDAAKQAEKTAKEERKAAEKAAKEKQKAAEKAAKEERKAAERAERENRRAQAPSDAQLNELDVVSGGTFCTNEGAQGVSDRSSRRILTCKMASDGNLRWKD
ncbi:hypothetical protein [Bombiscardovia apis]|nr:hypothetical protein [Bombiscardovia apis]